MTSSQWSGLREERQRSLPRRSVASTGAHVGSVSAMTWPLATCIRSGSTNHAFLPKNGRRSNTRLWLWSR